LKRINIIFAAIFIYAFSSGFQSDTLIEMKPRMLTEYVTDETGTLTEGELDSLRTELRNFYDTTSTQIVVYMISSLKGESLESASYSIAQKNGIGTKNNNGVLLFIVKDDRKLRIEVGYGLEGVLTDARAGRIISEKIVPHFKKGEYYKGIRSGVKEIIYVVSFEKFIPPVYYPEEKDFFSEYGSTLIIAGVMFAYLAILILLIILAVKKGGGSSGGSYWKSGSSSGSSSSSSAYRSISTGSSSRSSGFSGGGGSFGGGGASGSW
jgi:uncharacterized protein